MATLVLDHAAQREAPPERVEPQPQPRSGKAPAVKEAHHAAKKEREVPGAKKVGGRGKR